MYSRNAELYHHGIKGQKWGVQNGPPYPLNDNISTGKRLKETKVEDVKKVTDYLLKARDDEILYGKIQKELKEKIGDWYWGEAKTEKLKKATEKYEKQSWNATLTNNRRKLRKLQFEYENAWVEEALNALDLPITNETKEATYPIVIWD